MRSDVRGCAAAWIGVVHSWTGEGAMGENGVRVELNAADEQFEAKIDGLLAMLTVSEGDGKLYLLHTEVPDELEGQGVGSALVRAAMAHAREKHLRVVPFCPFARAYIERHEAEYADLLGAE
jgi:predicted GNAT family acetyltransferase